MPRQAKKTEKNTNEKSEPTKTKKQPNKNLRKKRRTEDKAYNLADFPKNIFGIMMETLRYRDIIHLSKTSKTIHKKIIQEMNNNILLELLRRDIQYYFGSTLDFSKFYTPQQHNALIQLPLFQLFEAVYIIGEGRSIDYLRAIKIVQEFSTQGYCVEANFLFVQLIRLKLSVNEIPGLIENSFSYADMLYTQNPDLLNTLTLAHFYFLLHCEHQRLPLAVSVPTISSQNTTRVYEAIKHLIDPENKSAAKPIIGINSIMQIHSNMNSIKRIQLDNLEIHDSDKTEVQVSSFFEKNIRELIFAALGEHSASFISEHQKLNPQMQWKYIAALCTPGASLFLQQLIQYSLLDKIWSLSPVQIKILCRADIQWLFDSYQNKTLEEIQKLINIQHNANSAEEELNLQFLNKTIKKYFQEAQEKPHLKELWELRDALFNPLIKEAVFVEMLSKTKGDNKQALLIQLKDLNDNQEKKELFIAFKKFFKEGLALKLIQTLDQKQATAYIDFLTKFPQIASFDKSASLVNEILQANDQLLQKLVTRLGTYEKKELKIHMTTFFLRSYLYAQKLKDKNLITDENEYVTKILNKLPAVNVLNQIKGNKTLMKCLIRGVTKPWFEMLTYEQIVQIPCRTLALIHGYPNDQQKIIIEKLINKYKDKTSFTPEFAEVKGFGVFAEDHIEQQSQQTNSHSMELSSGSDYDEQPLTFENTVEPLEESSSISKQDTNNTDIIKALLKQNENLEHLNSFLHNQIKHLEEDIESKDKEIESKDREIAKLKTELNTKNIREEEENNIVSKMTDDTEEEPKAAFNSYKTPAYPKTNRFFQPDFSRKLKRKFDDIKEKNTTKEMEQQTDKYQASDDSENDENSYSQ